MRRRNYLVQNFPHSKLHWTEAHIYFYRLKNWLAIRDFNSLSDNKFSYNKGYTSNYWSLKKINPDWGYYRRIKWMRDLQKGWRRLTFEEFMCAYGIDH